MRTEVLAFIAAITASFAVRAEAETVTITSERTLFVGEASSLSIKVALPSDAAQPLLLTVHAEGSALDVVRGRMSRESARTLPSSALSFAVPVIGRVPGTAVVRAHARFFRCTDTCRAQEAAAVLAVEVRTR
jgi:hypothetical protein